MLGALFFVRTVSGFWGTSTRGLSFYHFSCRDIRKMLAAVLFLHAVSGLHASSCDQTSASCSIGSTYPSQLSSQHCIVPDILKDSETTCEKALAEGNQLRHEVARQSKEIDKLRATIHSVSQLLSTVVEPYEEKSPQKRPPEDHQPAEEAKRLQNSKKRPRVEDKQSTAQEADGQTPQKPHWEGKDKQLPDEVDNPQPPQKRRKPNPENADKKGILFGDVD